MAVTVTVRDETATGDVYSEIPLEFPSERITVRELIRERVYQEVQDFNRKRDEDTFRGLVQPSDAEQALNGRYKLKKRREINWKEQFDLALEAFERNGFLLLVADRQAEQLDQEFTVGHGTEISFVKLTPLVGG